MIGKSIAKKGSGRNAAANIRALLRYVKDATGPMAKDGEKVLESGSSGFVCDDFNDQIGEMIALSKAGMAGTNSKNTIKHYMLSWQEGEVPTREQAESSVVALMKEMRLQDCQFVWALHNDTDNMHVHIAVNRVDPISEKLIDPAGGFEKEAIHKAIAKIEHAQGWRKEVNARYDIDEKGKAIRRDRNTDDKKTEPTQRARDMETRTGEKSQERIGIELAQPIIAEAKSWQDLHDGLDAIGMRYQREGGGAVIWTGAEFVKASTVAARKDSFAQLQKRLGIFEQNGVKNEFFRHEVKDADAFEHEARDRMQRLPTRHLAADSEWESAWRSSLVSPDAHANQDYAGALRRTSIGRAGRRDSDYSVPGQEFGSADYRSAGQTSGGSNGGDNSGFGVASKSGYDEGRREPLDRRYSETWQAYAHARSEHFATKKADAAMLNASISSRKSALWWAHSAEKKKVLGGSWKGKGAQRIAMGSMLAARHAQERAGMQEKITEQRKDLKIKYPRFDDFEQWLKSHDSDEAAYQYRHRQTPEDLDSEVLAQISGPNKRHVETQTEDIREFEAQPHGKWVRYYSGAGDHAFTDAGRQITMHKVDDASTLACLQLGAQKWGQVNVEGSKEFKDRCVRLAAENGITLSNPELAERVQELKISNKEAQATRAATLERLRASHRQRATPKPAPTPKRLADPVVKAEDIERKMTAHLDAQRSEDQKPAERPNPPATRRKPS